MADKVHLSIEKSIGWRDPMTILIDVIKEQKQVAGLDFPLVIKTSTA